MLASSQDHAISHTIDIDNGFRHPGFGDAMKRSISLRGVFDHVQRSCGRVCETDACILNIRSLARQPLHVVHSLKLIQ